MSNPYIKVHVQDWSASVVKNSDKNTTHVVGRQDWGREHLANGSTYHVPADFKPTMPSERMNMIFLLTAEEYLWASHFAKGATLADDPLNYVSMAEDEEAFKLLLLVAGDVETNPGPTVSAFSENVWHFINVFPEPGQAARFG